MASIRLIRYAASQSLGVEQHSWPLTIRAEGYEIPSEVFVHRAAKKGDPFGGSAFSCVASVHQLYEIPTNAAVALTKIQQIPWFRSSQVELVFRTAAEVDHYWQQIQYEVQLLLNNYNLSFSLQGVQSVTIGADNQIEIATPVNPPTQVQLSYAPAGTATLVDEVQGISSPTPNVPGWLPVSSAPVDWPIPAGAAFFYNIDLDPNLQAVWPLLAPLAGNALFRDGVILPYGITHVFDNNTIWWLAFNPATVPGYAPAGSALGGNAPWPTDFVSLSSPGAVSPLIYLHAFK